MSPRLGLRQNISFQWKLHVLLLFSKFLEMIQNLSIMNHLNIIDSTLCAIVALVHPNIRSCVYLFCNIHNRLSLVVRSNLEIKFKVF